MQKKINLQKGSLLVEMMVAATIISLSMIAAMVVTGRAVFVARESLHQAQAAMLLEEGSEAVKIFRDNAWSNISSLSTSSTYYPTFSGGTWTFPTSSTTVGIFTRTVTVANVLRDATTGDISATGSADSGTKLITITVSWTEGNTTLSKNLQFYISDIMS